MGCDTGFSGVKELADNGAIKIPANYVKPEEKRHKPREVIEGASIPCIDLCNPHAADEIAVACKEWGFFEIVNHGVAQGTIKAMVKGVREFFDLPTANKMKYYSEDVFNPMRYCTSLTPSKESILDWHDHVQHWFREDDLSTHPWPKEPKVYEAVAHAYVKEMQLLGRNLLRLMSQGLGLHDNALEKAYGGRHEMIMRLNYYPPCPSPDLALGLNPHSDSGGLTILWQQEELCGLQVQKDGKWYNVKARLNGLVINVGDQIEILSNGIFKSVIHRAIVNRTKSRMSMASFFNPVADTNICPIEELLSEENPAYYKPRVSKDYIGAIYNKYFEGKNVDKED